MPRRIDSLLPALLVCGALATTGIFHAWQRVEGIRLGYRLGEVTSEHRSLLRSNEHLRLELATLKAPSRIEKLARESFGMAPPRPGQVMVIRMGPPAGEGIDVPEPMGEDPPEGELASQSLSRASFSMITSRVTSREEPRG